jgi:F420H(2)-dependent quinone reductase
MSILKDIFTRIHALLLRITNGRLGNQLGRQSVLLLHTVGRKSGKPYDTPLSYYQDGENYLIVASNWGKENPPDWFLNLVEHPGTTILVKRSAHQVVARQAEGDEYIRLWEFITHQNSMYLGYQKRMMRRIPVVVLTPVSQSG